MSMVGFPLLLIPLAIYNILVFLMPGVSLADPLFRLSLMSGSEWPVTLSDILLALGVLMLLLEVVKGARPGTKYLTDHLLSLIVLGAAAAEFLLWPKFASSTYFLLTLMALADFLSGIALRTRRGMQPAVAISRRADKRADVKADVPASEPRFEPQPDIRPDIKPEPAPAVPPTPSASASPLPAAALVAESVLADRPEPRLAQPAASEPSPQAAPPGAAAG
jgi:hypothetical protein